MRGLSGGDDRRQWIELAVAVTAVGVIYLAVYRGSHELLMSRRKNKHALRPRQWKSLFTEEGILTDGGVFFWSEDGGSKLLEKVRSGGVDPSIRAEVWPFLLGVYDLDSSEKERESVRKKKRKEYEMLRKQCQSLLTQGKWFDLLKLFTNAAADYADSQRTIRLDAVRADDEWATYSPSQAALVSKTKAHKEAESVGLKLHITVDYEDLEPRRIFHAARLVAILEAYAMYDPEIGYCQGMSDLLAPIITVMEKDDEAFWCFVGFMKMARDNFRRDGTGIERQLSIISRIIRGKDVTLYRHLEKLQAADCHFVYKMLMVLLRRVLSFEQTLCLWEVMWADQAAIREGIAESDWGRSPPVDDLFLYAIAACVLQQRDSILECSSMEDIISEFNSMAGRLDVWKLLDDAHDLVVSLVTLHDKI
ncbi:rab GTPase-activating protein 22-like [Argentina anserina]|uniref:rab GTPase-activating protein 22-like n=1 Tax=Argentina anserina TaxID=57926 RepID=UPI0021762573|nr:rab GTPase-activating protein 22-like [Potentilla anserina]